MSRRSDNSSRKRDRPERDRPERDRPERDRSERGDRSERNRSERKRDRSDKDRSERDRSEISNGQRNDNKIIVKEEKSEENIITDDIKNKELVYEATMKIHAKMKEMGLPMHKPSKKDSILQPDEAKAFTQIHIDKLEKIKRLNELKSTTASKSASSLLKSPSMLVDSMVDNKYGLTKLKPVKKDESNFEKNAQQSTASSLQKTIGAEPDSSTGPIEDFEDPRIYLKSATRKRRNFEFKTPGEYVKMAKQQRSRAKLERLQTEIEKSAKQTGISDAVKLAIITPSETSSGGEFIPVVEWWDEFVLGDGKKYDDIPSFDIAPLDRYYATITDLVEHPIQLKPPDEPLQPQYLKATLTKKERKKLRRQNRREAIKEKTEKIRLGLDKPPEPKLKISNLMRVLGNDAIQDPTKMEVVVRKQMAERAQKHIEENKSRKLTREEKASKAIRKVAEDTSLAVHVAIYKVKSLANPAKKFKVLMNAKQLQMTGKIIQLEDINVIIVEGGPKQQKFYKNLMLNRIKWSEEIAGQRHVRKGGISTATGANAISQQKDEEEGSNQQINQGKLNECSLVWEGIVQKRAFNGEPRFIQVTNHKQARELLDKFGIAHYWDLCYATSVLLSEDK